MTLAIDLNPIEETRLQTLAQQGLALVDLARQFVTERLAPAPGADPMLALFAAWYQEDATMTPEQIEAENSEWEQFKANLKRGT